MSRKYVMWIVLAAIAAGGFFGYQYWRDMQSALPKGIASGNGRIEAKLVDIAAKEASEGQGNPRRRRRSRQAGRRAGANGHRDAAMRNWPRPG